MKGPSTGPAFRSERKRSPFLSLLLLALILLLAIPWPGIFYGLRVTHVQKGQILLTLPFVFHHPFSLSYTNSIYLAPVLEKFEVEGTRIHLQEVSTNSWGVAEYYGLPGRVRHNQGEIRMEGLNFQIPPITMMIGFTGKQGLIWENRIYSLYSLTGPGEKVRIEPIPLSPGRYFWEKIRLFAWSSGNDLR